MYMYTYSGEHLPTPLLVVVFEPILGQLRSNQTYKHLKYRIIIENRWVV